MKASRRSFGFNLIGHVSWNSGLGVLARHVATLIVSRGFPIAILDLPGSAPPYDLTFEKYTVPSIDALPYAVNLLVLPPQTICNALAADVTRRAVLAREGVLNAGLLMWEHLNIPRVWRERLEILDVVVTVTSFIRASVEASLSGVLTVSGACPVYLPPRVQGSRERFGLPGDAVVFVTSFELYSPERKNMLGVLEAFRRAFPDGGRALLVIKVNNSDQTQKAVAELRQVCGDDPRVRLIEAPLTYRDVLSLYASCDVYVSLHRSEGLGLGLMEAMALGKPVIATAWSGNMSYMDPTNACLVGYRLVPVVSRIPEYSRKLLGRSAMWADADLDDAAAWMRRVIDAPGLRATLGQRAAETMSRHQEEAGRGRFLDELKVIHDYQLEMPTLRRKQEMAFRSRWNRACHRASNPLGVSLRREVRRMLDRHILWRFPRWRQ